VEFYRSTTLTAAKLFVHNMHSKYRWKCFEIDAYWHILQWFNAPNIETAASKSGCIDLHLPLKRVLHGQHDVGVFLSKMILSSRSNYIGQVSETKSISTFLDIILIPKGHCSIRLPAVPLTAITVTLDIGSINVSITFVQYNLLMFSSFFSGL